MKRKNKLVENVFVLVLMYAIGVLFSFFLTSLFSMFNFISNVQLQAFIASIISVLVVLSMLYGSIWSMGERDANMVAYGHLKERRWRGALIGFLALFIPILTMGFCLIFPQDELAKLVLNIIFMPLLGTVAYLKANTFVTCIIFITAAIVVCGTGYFFGYKGISFMNKVWYKKDKKQS